jgi:hypothetical protein
MRPGRRGSHQGKDPDRLRERRRPHLTATEFQAHQEQITILLQEVTPTAAWRRLRREQGLQASLSSFRRHLRQHPSEQVRQSQITVRRPFLL